MAKSDYEKWRIDTIEFLGRYPKDTTIHKRTHKALQMLDIAMEALLELKSKRLFYAEEAIDQINAIAGGKNGKD